MGGFEEHKSAVVPVFPIVSIAIGVAQFALTTDSTLVLLTLVLGSGLMKMGSTLPDIDHDSAIPRRILGYFLTILVMSGIVSSAIFTATEQTGIFLSTMFLPNQIRVSMLALLAMLWMGMVSPHRSRTHSIGWGSAISVLIGVFVYFLFEPLDSWLSLVLAVGLGLYFFTGLFTHLQLDDNIELLWSDDDRDFPDHTRYFGRLNSDYLFLSSIFLVWGLSTFRAALPIMLILIFGYIMIVVGRVLPEIDRKSVPRWYFDRFCTFVLIFLLAIQLLQTGFELRQEFVRIANGFPSGTVPALGMLGLVLWMGRDSKKDTLTHSLRWLFGVSGSFWIFLFIISYDMPWNESLLIIITSGSYLTAGLLRHFLIDEEIPPLNSYFN